MAGSSGSRGSNEGGGGVLELDFIARFAAAWDGRGDFVFYPPREHDALCALCYLAPERARCRWAELEPLEREKLIRAARLAIELGQNCAAILSP